MAIISKSIQCAREVAILLPQVNFYCVRDGVADTPSFSTTIAYALDRVKLFEAQHGAIDAAALMGLAGSYFNIPQQFDCDTRYECKLRCSDTLLANIDQITARLAADDFSSRVYRNFTVRFLLRAVIAIEQGICPVRCEEDRKHE